MHTKIVRNNKGFGLMSVIMVSGVGLILAGVTTTMLVDFLGMQRAGEFRMDSDVFGKEVRSILSSKQACINSFRGLSLSASMEHEVTRINNKAGQPEYIVGDFYGDNTIRLASMQLEDYVSSPYGGRSGYATLYVNTEKTGEGKGLGRITREIQIAIVRNNSGQIDNCIAIAEMTDGIWTRSDSNPLEIYYTEGNVGVGVDRSGDILRVVDDDLSVVVIQNEESTGPGQGTGLSFVNFAGTTNINYPFLHMHAARGSHDSPQGIKADDGLAAIGVFGYTGAPPGSPNAWALGGNAPGAIWVRADEDFSPATTGARMTFHTTPHTARTAGEAQIEQMRIASNGSIGIGTQQPLAKLHVHNHQSQGNIVVSGDGDGNNTWAALYLSSNASNPLQNAWVVAHKKNLGGGNQDGLSIARITGGSVNPEALAINTNGFIGISRNVPQSQLDVGGESLFVGNSEITGNLDISGNLEANYISTPSDRNLKKDLDKVEDDLLKRLERLSAYSYQWKGQERNELRQIGVIAQEVREVFPELVRADETGRLAVDYNGLAALSISAINEVSERDVETRKGFQICQLETRELEDRLHDSEREIHQLKTELSDLEKELEDLLSREVSP